MKKIIVKDNIEGAKIGFEMIQEGIQDNTLDVLGLATGSTPESLYKLIRESNLDFSDVVSVNLDEYVGLDPKHDQSYHYFMQENLFNAKPFKASFLPNGSNLNAEEECAAYEKILAENPIDLQILGIGTNGHIGFNEPGSTFDSLTRKVELTPETIEANARFFESKEEVPTHAYSMGIGSILKSKKIVLFAYGENKAEAVRRLFEEEANEDLPASALKNHPDVTIVIDEKAASKLS